MEPYRSTLCHSEQLKLKCKQKPQIQSINQLYQEQQGSQCSYCKEGLSYSWGLVSANYQPYTYQTMMERGWRRCGTYYYKLDLQQSCCKQWTHRLNVNQFKMKRDQKKNIKRMMAWVYEPVVEMKQEKTQGKQQKKHNNQENKQNRSSKHSKQQPHKQKGQQQLTKQKSTNVITQLCPKTQQFIKSICAKLNQIIQAQLNAIIPKQKLNPDNIGKDWNMSFLDKLKSFPSKPQQKSDYYCNWGMLLYGLNKTKFVKQFSLIDFIKVIKETVQKVELSKDYNVRLQRGGYLLIELGQKLKEDKEFEVIKEVRKQQTNKNHKMQIQLSKQTQKPQSQQPNLKMQLQNCPQIRKRQSSNAFQKLEPQFKGQLTITSDKITFGRITIHLVQAQQNNESWKMYQRYCTQIHGKDEKGLSSYTNFLCQRALTFGKEQKIVKQGQKQYLPAFDPVETHQQKKPVTGTVTKRQGCYHMKYYFDDKFIAVGVIDLLPNGLSSVYFFYQPEYKEHRLGVFSSLIEIQYIRYLSLTFPEFKYYYMGFYIHNNDKMAYKGDYEPFQLLCPISYNFITVDERVEKIVDNVAKKEEKNIRLAPEGIPTDPDMIFTTDLGLYIDKNIKITYRKKPLKLKEINPEFYIPVLMILKSYLGVLGKEVFDIFTFTF